MKSEFFPYKYTSIIIVVLSIIVGIFLFPSSFFPASFKLPSHGDGVVVTGASTGIGYDAALRLAQLKTYCSPDISNGIKNSNSYLLSFFQKNEKPLCNQFTVYAGVRSTKDVKSMKALGYDNLIPVKIDVTNQRTIDEAKQYILSDLRLRQASLHGLVNNAGIAKGGPVETTPLDVVDQVFDVNYYGVLRMIKAFAPELRANQGRVINISSIAGKYSGKLLGIYASSKFALEAISDSFRNEMKSFGVAVSVVEPGAVQSAIFNKQEGNKKTGSPPAYMMDPIYKDMHRKPEEWEAIMKKADSPKVTSDVILHALVNRHPRIRYVVANLRGLPSTTFLFLNWLLPDEIKDRCFGI